MDDCLIEEFYGTSVEVHIFARDPQSSLEPPVEFVRNATLVKSSVSSGKLLDKFDPDKVYHVPETNSLYFDETFSDFDIAGTVDGSAGLIIYCDFYDAYNPQEVADILLDGGWAIPSNLS